MWIFTKNEQNYIHSTVSVLIKTDPLDIKLQMLEDLGLVFLQLSVKKISVQRD